MAPRPTLTFPYFTAANWAKAQELLKEKYGISLSGESGQETAKGITLRYAFDGAGGKLELQLLGRAWFDPSADTIEADLRQAVAEIQKPAM